MQPGRTSKVLLGFGTLAATAILLLSVARPVTSKGVVPSGPDALHDEGHETVSEQSRSVLSGDRDCAGVFYPIVMTIELNEEAAPGQIATATVRVSVTEVMGDVELECTPGPDLQLLSDRRIEIDRLVPGETYEQDLAVRLPASLDRRVVEVTVRGWMNGALLRRSTIWNLVPGGAEASREVTRPDGSRVREVTARRVR